MDEVTRSLLADVILFVHLGFVLFIAGGLAAIYAGGFVGARFVGSFPFRVCHLAAIAFVTLEAFVGIVCPLTWLEAILRTGDAPERSFMSRVADRILFYENVPDWVFPASYAAVLLLTIAVWRRFPPRR